MSSDLSNILDMDELTAEEEILAINQWIEDHKKDTELEY